MLRSRDPRAARGFQYGFLVADEYAESVRVYRAMTYQNTGMSYDFFVERAVELHADKIPTNCARKCWAWQRV